MARGLFLHVPSNRSYPMLSVAKVVFLGVVVAIWSFRVRDVQGALGWFYLQLLLSFVIEFACMILIQLGERNIWLYNCYLPVEFLLFAGFVHVSLHDARAWWVTVPAILVYAALFYGELLSRTGSDLLFSRSLMFGWGYLAVVITYLLVQLAKESVEPIWREQLFWVYLSAILFFGVSLPFIGLLNRIYRHDRELAVDLLVIMDVLYFLSYGLVGVAGWKRWRRSQGT